MKYSILRSYENFHFGLSLDEIEIEIVTRTLWMTLMDTKNTWPRDF